MQKSGKFFRHVKDQRTVLRLMDEIRNRHGRSYDRLIEEAMAQIAGFFSGSFEGRTAPGRFADLDEGRLDLVRQRLIVALSGGLDSTVVTYLAVRAVGKENVLTVTMPAHVDDDSCRMAELTRDDLGFDEPDAPYVIPIHGIVEAHMRTMAGLAPQMGLAEGHREQSREQLMRSGNFASRVRIGILYDLQRSIRGRVLGTMNRTEYCQGYGVKFGTPDAFDFGVLNELYKVDVQEMGMRLGIPQAVLDAAPSTGFYSGQTHEGELGATLEEQDIITYLLFEKGASIETIVRDYGMDEEFVRTMHRRFVISEHKRVLCAQPHVRFLKGEFQSH